MSPLSNTVGIIETRFTLLKNFTIIGGKFVIAERTKVLHRSLDVLSLLWETPVSSILATQVTSMWFSIKNDSMAAMAAKYVVNDFTFHARRRFSLSRDGLPRLIDSFCLFEEGLDKCYSGQFLLSDTSTSCILKALYRDLHIVRNIPPPYWLPPVGILLDHFNNRIFLVVQDLERTR